MSIKKNKRKNDPQFKMRKYLSTYIGIALKKSFSSKNKLSIMQYLPYTIQDLKLHLEVQFEAWMTWTNGGRCNINTWNDNDPNTWTWQIDHIIPQSDLLYTSMEDDNFKKCWALENLQPLNAKINLANRKK